MQRILVVCLGNICRSPLAEGILLHLVKEKKLNVTIDSAGTSDYHIDECPDRRTIANAKKNGIDLSPLRARQFKQSDFDEFDKIFVMDRSNMANVLRLARHNHDKAKVELLLNVLHPGQDLEVPDPYFGGEQGFEDVFQMVYKACEKLLDSLEK
jgi:protein-tyrosine phosphatase